MKTNFTVGNNPVAYITQNKQRIKQYGDKIYLSDGDEFELEIFNGSTNKVLAKVEMNGKLISDAGLVVRPGERIFLDRYFDEAKKFLFETYNVDGNDTQVLNAIRQNGLITVKFFNESTPQLNVYTYTTPSIYYYNSPIGTTTGGNCDFTLTGTNTAYSTDMTLCCDSHTKSLETGTVAKGGNSNQDFTNDYSNFNCYHSYSSTWQILPNSVKPLEKEDLMVKYCPSCGSKRKKDSHKFCPLCGTKY